MGRWVSFNTQQRQSCLKVYLLVGDRSRESERLCVSTQRDFKKILREKRERF